jgi:hypothetical protein
MNPTSRASISGGGWLTERARILQRICKTVEGRRARGQSLHRALRWHVWCLRRRTYKSAPGKRVRLCEGTLGRIYYAWLASGRDPRAFALNYKFSRQPVSADVTRAFIRANAAPQVFSMHAAWRHLRETWDQGIPLPNARTLIESLPTETRKALRQMHRERRKLAGQSAMLCRQIEGLANGS